MSATRNLPPAEGHLGDTLALIGRRWRTLVAAFVGFMAVAAAVNLRLPQVYQSTASIVIGSGSQPGLLSEGLTPLEGYLLELRSFETQLEIMRSEPVALEAARALGWLDEKASLAERDRLSGEIKAAITVQHLRDTRIVLLRARDSAPERAQALANALAEAYIAFSEEQASAARRRSVAWLTDEIASLRQRLRSSEERLVDYLASQGIEGDAVQDADSGGGPAGDDGLRTSLKTAELELSGLLGRYRSRHPKVEEARQRVAGLRAAVARDQTLRTEESRKLIQVRLARRDAELDQEMYDVLLKKLKEADLSGGIAESGIRVLEAAKLPSVPIAPRLVRNLAVSAVVGLCLALCLALGVEYFDRSIGSAEEASRAFGLPTLGVVGHFARGAGEAGLAVDGSGDEVAEMFRTLRTNLRFSHVDLPRRVVLVTSTGAAEGKSTIVANLGASLSRSGRRTLLVDTDLRRPSLHRTLHTAKRPGLADVLAGDAEPREALYPTHVPDLDVMVAGTVPANPAELIESARLQTLLAALRDDYDYILLDSPPAAGLVDACLLAALADGVVFVIEPRRFDLRLVRAALTQLDRAGARLYGLVLNKAPRHERIALYGAYGERSRGEGELVAAGPA